MNARRNCPPAGLVRFLGGIASFFGNFLAAAPASAAQTDGVMLPGYVTAGPAPRFFERRLEDVAAGRTAFEAQNFHPVPSSL